MCLSISQLQLFKTFAPLFNQIEQQLHKVDLPIMLFKNISRRKEMKKRTLRTIQLTFIIELKTKAIQDLKKLIDSTIHVSIYLQMHWHLYLELYLYLNP